MGAIEVECFGDECRFKNGQKYKSVCCGKLQDDSFDTSASQHRLGLEGSSRHKLLNDVWTHRVYSSTESFDEVPAQSDFDYSPS